MARKIINQQSQAPVSPLTLGGFFTPAKISQSGGLLRVSANAETVRSSGFKDLYLPLNYLADHFGGIPAGLVIHVTIEHADGASTIPVDSVEQAQKRGADGRRIGYDTGAAGSMVPPGLIRQGVDGAMYPAQYAPPAPTARITGGRRPAAPHVPAPTTPTAPSEASSLTDRVKQLEQGISAILDALKVGK